MNEIAPRRSDDEIIRSMIEKENEYIHYRVTWFCTLQGLLLTALSFASSQPKAAPLLSLFCGLGIAVAVVMFHPIYYAHRTMMNLLDWWDTHKPRDYNGPDVMGGRPKHAFARHVGPWHALPALFLVAWCIIWVIRSGLS